MMQNYCVSCNSKECPVYDFVRSQCGPCRDPLTIIAASNTWCHILRYKAIDLKELCKLGEEIPIVYPWSPTYNTKRLLYNKFINEFPSAIVMAEKVRHVQRALAFAHKHDIPISVRGGGHSVEGFSLTEGIVIDLSRMNKVKVLDGDRVVAVGAGCLIGPTLLKLQEHGLVFPTGTCANVGVAGLTLGGGVGFLDRKWGLTCDNLVEVEAVLADGRVIVANETENTDLFWACKGAGGGNFCVVTKCAFRLHRLEYVYLFTVKYDWNAAQRAVDVFQRWAPFASGNLGAELSLKGKQRGVVIEGQWCGDLEGLEKELRALNPIGVPSSKNVRKSSVLDAAREHTDNNTRPPFQKVKSSFVYKPIANEGIEELVEWAGKIKTEDQSDGIVLSAMSGAISKVGENDTAFLHRKAIMWIEYQTYYMEQRQRGEKLEWVTGAWEAVRPYVTKYCYVNFPDLQVTHWKWAFWGRHYNTLVDIKRIYDPTDVFHMPQGVRLQYLFDAPSATK